MSEPEPAKLNRKVVLALVILPVWLFGSTLVGLWFWTQRNDEAPEPAKFVTEIDEKSLNQELMKVLQRVGIRHTGSEAGRTGLRRMAAYIEGTLGPDNAGYRVERLLGPLSGEEAWPIVLATLPGGDAAPLWVVAVYDQNPSSGGVEENATGVASVLAVAQALGGDRFERPVVFGFLPHGYDPDAPVDEMVELLGRRKGDLEGMLVVESMGMGEAGLLVSSTSSAAVELPGLVEQAKVVDPGAVGLDGGDTITSVLVESGVPAVRVSTRSVVSGEESDQELPDAAGHASATVALADLIRRLADSGKSSG